jgi:flagella basal body P-ring formation protein FlgA
VTGVPVTANTPLQAGDVLLARRDVTMVPDSIAAPAAVGLTSRRSLRAAKCCARASWPRPCWSSAACRQHRRAQGAGGGEHGRRGLDPGALGQVIRVRNAASGTVIRARVVDAGVVEPAEIPGR